MPLPTPNKDEKQSDYVGRCMEFWSSEDTKLDQKQQLASCYDRYRRWKKNRKKRDKAKERAKKRIEESKSLVHDLNKLKEYFDGKYRMGSR